MKEINVRVSEAKELAIETTNLRNLEEAEIVGVGVYQSLKTIVLIILCFHYAGHEGHWGDEH